MYLLTGYFEKDFKYLLYIVNKTHNPMQKYVFIFIFPLSWVFNWLYYPNCCYEINGNNNIFHSESSEQNSFLSTLMDLDGYRIYRYSWNAFIKFESNRKRSIWLTLLLYIDLCFNDMIPVYNISIYDVMLFCHTLLILYLFDRRWIDVW